MLSERSTRIDNNLLRYSLVQDLKTLDDLNHVISEENSGLITNSWLHPNQTIEYQPETILEMKIQSNEDYTDCLELIIDRIYSVLGSLLIILDKRTRTHVDIHNNVIKPPKLTLSLLTTALYEKIHRLRPFQRDNKLHEIQPHSSTTHLETSGKANKESQANIKITQCPCCFITQKCIKSIAEKLAKVESDGYVTEAKEKMKSVIFTSTQEESLDLLTRAINNDVQGLIENSKQLQAKLDDVKVQLDKVEVIHQASLHKIGKLETSIEKLEKNVEKEKQKQAILHNIINKLFKDKKKLQQDMKGEEDQIKQLEGVIEEQSNNIKNLRDELENFKTNNERLLSQTELIGAERDLWKARFERAQEQKIRIRCENKALRSNLQQIREIISSIEQSYISMEKSISESYNLIENSVRGYRNLMERIEDVVKSSAILEDKLNYYAQNVERITSVDPSVTDTATEDVEVKGDPMLDMIKQIECNSRNIAKMKQQNEVLSKIIQKFQERNINNN